MNLWSRFNSLLPSTEKRLIGEVIAAQWGSCTVEWPGGGTITAEGAGTIGQRYYVLQRVDGTWRLDGEAASLQYIVIDL